MDGGLHHGGVDAQPRAILHAEPDGGLDHRRVERAHGGRRQPTERPMEGIVFGGRPGVERREPPPRVAVGDPLAQFGQIPGLDPSQHEGATEN
jgi:hypothetical protein